MTVPHRKAVTFLVPPGPLGALRGNPPRMVMGAPSHTWSCRDVRVVPRLLAKQAVVLMGAPATEKVTRGAVR